MGVDVLCVFDNNVRSDDLADVLGILAGLPKSRRPLRDYGDAYSVEVEGATIRSGASIGREGKLVEPCSGTSQIDLNGDMVDGDKSHWTMLHWESTSGQDHGIGLGFKRVMIPPSTPFWCAVCKRAVEFFGGWLAYDDSTFDGTWDVVVPIDWSKADHSNENWQNLQDQMYALEPVTYCDMAAMLEHCAYPDKMPPEPSEKLEESLKEMDLSTTP